jgi:hypothetical protein
VVGSDFAQSRRKILDARERVAFEKSGRIQRGVLLEQSTNGLGDVRAARVELAEPESARLLIEL